MTQQSNKCREAGLDALPREDGQVVLLVDDEDTLVSLGEEVLADPGYEPVGFNSSLAAWEALEAELIEPEMGHSRFAITSEGQAVLRALGSQNDAEG